MSHLLKPNQIRLRLNVIVGVVGFIANAAMAFVSYRLILHFGGLELLGLWSVLLSATFLIRIGDLGLGGAGLRYVAALPQNTSLRQARQLIDTILLSNSALYLLLATIGLAVLIYGFPVISGVPAGSPEARAAEQVIPILMFGFFLQGIALPTMSVLQGLHHGYLSSVLTSLGVLIQLGFAIALIPSMGLAGLAWAMVIQHIFVALIGWILVLRITGSVRLGLIPLNFSLNKLRQTVRYGIGLQAVNITNGLFEPIAKLLISRFCGLEVLGIFELAFKTMHVLRGTVTASILATIPATASLMTSDPAEAGRLYLKTRRRTFLAILMLLCLAVPASPLISLVWLDTVDETLVLALAIVAFGIFGNILGAPAYALGLASGKLRGNFISNGAALISVSVLVPVAARLHDLAAIGATAMAMVLGGLTVKWFNEWIILPR